MSFAGAPGAWPLGTWDILNLAECRIRRRSGGTPAFRPCPFGLSFPFLFVIPQRSGGICFCPCSCSSDRPRLLARAFRLSF